MTFLVDETSDYQHRRLDRSIRILIECFPTGTLSSRFLSRSPSMDRQTVHTDSRHNGIDQGHSCSAESIESVDGSLSIADDHASVKAPFPRRYLLPHLYGGVREPPSPSLTWWARARARRSFSSSSSFLQLGLAFSFFLPFAPCPDTNGGNCTRACILR